MDPIVAISSAHGSSWRAIVRISGADLEPLVTALFEAVPKPRQLCTAHLSLNGAALPVMAMWMPGPATFTGQDTLEIQTPGSRPLLTCILDHVLEASQKAVGSGRLAEAGEFSRRAFEAGRIDLTEAEGIAATISAMGDAELQAAAHLRAGHLGRWAESMVAQIGDLLARVEAGIDFTDQEDVVTIPPGELAAGIDAAVEQIRKRLGESARWQQVDAPPRVVLAGPPNAGKSTLFNALVGHQRVVVSPTAGTTRDPVTEPLQLDDRELLLVDTAGLFGASESLDAAAVAAARRVIESADLLLWIQEAGDAPVEPPSGPQVKRIWSKTDQNPPPVGDGMGISVVQHEGLEAVRQMMADRLSSQMVQIDAQRSVLQDRHRQAMTQAEEELVETKNRFDPGQRHLASPELVADAMRTALDHLGQLGGQMSADDVLGRVFATFCVGK